MGQAPQAPAVSDHLRTKAAAGFHARYGGDPTATAVAPGRVNLLGGHVDYNDGCVLPVAIDRAIAVAGAPTGDDVVTLSSATMPGDVTFRLERIERGHDWGDYPKGIVRAHRERGEPVGGFRAHFVSNLPLGGGVSSSAAVDVAVAALLQALFDFRLPGPEVARLAQEADNTFVGIRCGIMDQFASAMGRADHVLHLDCRTLAYEHVPLDLERQRIVVVQSGVQRGLVDSEYNARRAECERGRDVMRTRHPSVRALRDVCPQMLEECRDVLPETTYKRCKHVVDELVRVEAGIAALRQGDLRTFGQQVNGSHPSLRDLYEVSCPELDLLVETAQATPGCLGARITGAGFGGCTANLVETDRVDAFLAQVGDAFASRFGRRPEAMVCQSRDGAFAHVA